MIYVILALSLIGNGVLVWYIRKLLQKYWADMDVRQRFIELLSQYAESLQSIYKLEEFYGEEIIKKAVTQTRFVQEACEEYKKILETDLEEKETYQEEDSEEEAASKKDSTIKLKEGESVSQEASNYKRVTQADF